MGMTYNEFMQYMYSLGYNREEIEHYWRNQEELIAMLNRPLSAEEIEQQKRARANRFMANFKDEDGTRKFFSVKDGTRTTYVDVNTTKEVILIDDVISTLCKQMKGLNKSIKKAKIRKRVLEGQMQIEELQSKVI